MKKIIKIIFLFITFNVYSQDSLKWNFKFSGFMNSKTIDLPSGGKVNNFSHNGTCKDSLENYGKGFCYGIIESRENKDSFFQLY